MGGTDGPSPSFAAAGAVRWWRWALLVSVIGGVVGMHVLTGGDMISAHGPLPTAAQTSSADHSSMRGMHAHGVPGASAATNAPSLEDVSSTGATGTVSAVTAGTVSAVHGSGGGAMSHDGMAACVLFLVVGGSALLAMLLTLRARSAGDLARRAGDASVVQVMRRGPPGPMLPRLALCVDRI